MRPAKPRGKLAVLTFADGTKAVVRDDPPPSETFGRGQFMILFQDAVQEAVYEFRSGPALRVLMLLPKILDWRSWRMLDQQALADELGLDRAQVARALAAFIERGYVERRGKPRFYQWRLTPKLGWRGSVKAYHAAMRAASTTSEQEPAQSSPEIAESILWKVKAQSCFCGRHIKFRHPT